MRDFFQNIANVDPPWLDREAFRPGVRAFYANADLILVAFVTGVLVEGFSTLISKSFNTTKRVEQTKRRLMQNNRQLLEIFYPEGLNRNNAGWKLSTRVRFVHAQIRYLLASSEVWDSESWGTPLSAAHLGYATCTFSQSMLNYSRKVGAKFTKTAQLSILDIWRYTGYVMGVPESILFTSQEEAKEIRKIGLMCEPGPTKDSVEMANNLIKAIPAVAGITDPREQKETIELAYRLSRALIGHQLANQYNYPKSSSFLTLFVFRWKQFLQKHRSDDSIKRFNNFNKFLHMSVYDRGGLKYELPDHVHNECSSKW